MRSRTILYTGKGGVGKTSVAGCTARACARSGLRTLVLSTDPAHSLSESLGVELGADPRPAGDRLWGQEVSAQVEMERHWSGVKDWLGELFLERGLDRISAEELTVPPGMDELFSLLRLLDAQRSGEWEAIIVDCAPTGETLRLLAFPDVARWWIDKVFPLERQILATAGPLARSLFDIPIPTHSVFADIRRLSENLIAMNEILRDPELASVRLVMNPEKMVIGEAMRTFTYLNLYGYLTDAVIVNRVFPFEVGDYFSGWREVQEQQLRLVRSAFLPVPVLCAPYFEQEVVGPEMLDRLAAALFDSQDLDPAAVLHQTITHQLEVSERHARLRLPLPLAAKEDIELKKAGLELIVGVNGQRRTIALPPALAGYEPTGARFDDPPEALRRIEQRLSKASEAAERLITEAAWGRDRPPPAGWQASPGGKDAAGRRRATELELLIGGIRTIGGLVPPEVLERLAAALRELLLAMRALIDFYLERLEHRRPEHQSVQDIPIE